MLLLLLKQCLQEQARHVYGTTLWMPSCQMSKLCSDTCHCVTVQLSCAPGPAQGDQGKRWQPRGHLCGRAAFLASDTLEFPMGRGLRENKTRGDAVLALAPWQSPISPQQFSQIWQRCFSSQPLAGHGQLQLQPQPSLCSCPRYSCVPFKESRCARAQKVPEL